MLRDFTWTEKYEEAISDEHSLEHRQQLFITPAYITISTMETVHGVVQIGRI